jgi:hypothetical protein
MKLNEKITTQIKSLGGQYINREVDTSTFKEVNFDELPKCIYELTFCIDWKDIVFSMLDPEEDTKEADIDWEDDELYLYLRHTKVEMWGHDDLNINTLSNFDNMGDRKYILIGSIDDNYSLLIFLNNKVEDGDPEVHIVYPYENEDENLYYSEKLSVFLESLILNQEPIIEDEDED